MSQLGARFREARETRGLTLAQAAAGTRILPRYLQALEEGDLEQLPGDVYARGFIRNYAQFLGVPADELLHYYRQERGTPTDRIRVMPAAVPPRTRSCLMPSAFFSFFSILVLLGVLYWIANVAGLTKLPPDVALLPTETPIIPTPTTWVTATPQPSDAPSSPLPPTPAPAGVPADQPAPTPTPTLEAPLVVEVRIAPDAPKGSWMTVSVDGKPGVFTGTLLAAASQRFPAQREVFLHVGDASVVELVVNGESKGRMGTVSGGTAKQTITPPITGSTP
ncbi:MAG: helix-turn-helix domain-containing protein [Chloroflexota bacterium]|nr:helix-turn-helix domain-containing protein [Chloroflexota bacterium]PLS79620.1 MAG: DUF4115 domain-containing protein [Chloroflexota bacterium]